MSMKKILMAAVAVTALTAGSANAAKFDLTNTKLGTDNTYALGITALSTAGADIPEAFTIANEYTPSSSTIVYNKIVVNPTTTAAIGQGNYVVTFNLTGGEFSSPSTIDTTFLTGLGAVAPLAGTDVTATSMGATSATSVSFNVTVNTGKFMGPLTFKAPVLTGTARTPVSMSGSITTGGSAVDGGAIAAIPLIDYRNGYAFTATKGATAVKLSIASGFKKFGSGALDATSAALGSVVGFVTTNGVAGATNGYYLSDYVFKNTSTDTTGAITNVIAVSDISNIVATVAGDFSSFDPYIGSLQQTSLPAAVNGVMTLDAANLATFKTVPPTGTVGLKQKATAVAGNAASYTIAAVPTITGLAGSVGVVYSAKALASTVLEGTNIYASWVGDGSNGFNYTIRLGNLSPSAISSVKAYLLNPVNTGTSGTVASTATCEVGPIPALKEVLVTSAKLTECFGAFQRADVRLTIQTDQANLTAKLRVTDPSSGSTTTDLGTGISVAVQ